jgi:hypothetical protein
VDSREGGEEQAVLAPGASSADGADVHHPAA